MEKKRSKYLEVHQGGIRSFRIFLRGLFDIEVDQLHFIGARPRGENHVEDREKQSRGLC
jgi:hypothetical protein